MKTTNRTKTFCRGAAILGAVLLAGNIAAAVITQTVSQSGADANGWVSPIWGAGPSVATNGNVYITPPGFFVRTPNNTTPGAFGGDSLTISNGTLYLKHNNGVATANLVLSAGTITYHGGPGGTNVPLGGTLQVLTDPAAATSTVNSDQASANRDIWLLSTLSGSGNLTVNMLAATNALVLFGNNPAYSGNWTNIAGTIQIAGGTTNALGSGSVTLSFVTSTYLVFNSTNNLVVNNAITGKGNVTKANTNMVTLNGVNTFTGTVLITNGVLQLGVGSSLATASVISLAGGTLDASLVGGLTMSSGGQSLNGNGALIGSLTAATTNTLNFKLTASTNDILNVTGSLTLNGNPTLNLSLSAFKPSGVYRLINYSGAIQGGGSFNLVPPAGSTESFQLDTNTPGQVNLIVTGAAVNLTWVGDGSGNNWDTTSLNWTGDTNIFVAGDNATFNDSGSAVPDINLNTVMSPNNMTVNNTSARYIFDGSGISTAGTLTKTGTNELDFTSPGNNFTGPIVIQSGILSLGVGGSFGSLGTGPITNNGILQVNLANNGAAFNAPISGTGSLQITGGGASVVLGVSNSYAGLTSIGNGCQLNISSGSALGATTTGTIVQANGRLGVVSAVGSLTVPEPLVINGTGIAAAPGALYVNTANNNVTWAGPVIIGSDARVRAVNAGVHMNFANTVLGTNVALECSAGNVASDTNTVITFQSSFSLGSGGALTTDGPGIVVLVGSSNLCAGATVNAGTLLVNGPLTAGSVTVNATATLGGSGIISGPVTVQNGGSLAPGNSGIGTLTVGGSVALSGTTVMEINRTNTPNADLVVAAGFTFDNTLTVTNIASDLQSGDTFHLFSGPATGAFVVTNLPVLSATNLFWDISLLQSQGVIKVASSGATPPDIHPPFISGTNFNVQVDSQNGANYVLEATPLIAPASWASLQTNAGNGGTLTFTIPITPANPQRFFRVGVQ